MPTITIPGLIDPHVHLRDPGQTHKEDFLTGTSAALAGGYTTVIDMPNNLEPIVTLERLVAKVANAQAQTVCDIGFHFGTLGNHFEEFLHVAGRVEGLKVYLNHTTGGMIIDKDKLMAIYEAWPSDKPILLHAESDVSTLVGETIARTRKNTHICHVSSQSELEFVIQAKMRGLPVTCGVTPHHLFLNRDDAERLGPFGSVKPALKPQSDVDFLWQHLDAIDIIESDHAPHTREEKQSATVPFGVPGLETSLPLMFTAQQEGRLTKEKLVSMMHYRPAEIFGIVSDESTNVVVSTEEYELRNENLKTKCGWTPFAGRHVVGKVERVTLRGNVVYENGAVLARPGSGRLIS